jgi:hypothetical protein
MSEGDVVMAEASIYDRVLDPASRANPYPLYANPVLRGPRHLLVDFDTVARAERVRAASPAAST